MIRYKATPEKKPAETPAAKTAKTAAKAPTKTKAAAAPKKDLLDIEPDTTDDKD
ncbi:hypothetical protein [Hoeflea ulvae]|uniref:Malic enzyme n=1 Tax=Hoeflea ulvae TaxID=2983764 RepID=A0ABT3YFG7_9HYPH|nr:hypothetical protein [Hoeflea ulvae]MCY0094557.1 hypothetical protein [Hoeflea ulvae]